MTAPTVYDLDLNDFATFLLRDERNMEEARIGAWLSERGVSIYYAYEMLARLSLHRQIEGAPNRLVSYMVGETCADCGSVLSPRDNVCPKRPKDCRLGGQFVTVDQRGEDHWFRWEVTL